MPTVDTTPINETAICEKHEKILKARAIPLAFALSHGLSSVNLGARKKLEQEYKLEKKYKGLPYYTTTGILIEYPPCLDQVERYRVRADETTVTIAGEIEGAEHHGEHEIQIPRYIAQAGVSVAPYITPEAMAAANDTSVSLYLTEAPLKALSLTANGWPAIGMGGIYAGVVDLDIRRDTDQMVAHPEMRRIRWKGRTAYICYDAGIGSADDGLGNPQVAQAAARLWRCLSDLGAVVRLVNTPYTHPQQTDLEAGQLWSPTDQGPDDFLAAHGVEAFQALIDASVPVDPVTRIKEATDGLRGAERAVAVGQLLKEPIVQGALSEASESTLVAVAAIGVKARAIKSITAEFAEKLAASSKKDDAKWLEKLHTTASGAARACVENVELALRHDPGLDGMLGFDEMSQAIVFRKAPPWLDLYRGSASTKPGDAWTDVDDLRLAGYLAASAGIVDIHPPKVRAATLVVAKELSVNPVTDYLGGLIWDGQKRVGSWLSTFLGAEYSEYSVLVGRMWLVSAVARALDPGCQADHVLVLEGSQGLSKSSVLRVLGGDHFSEADLGDLRNKESALSIQGSWIHEFKEGEIFQRASFRALKGFITLLSDDIVPKYSNKRVSLPRRCVFTLSINDFNDYLADDENRRFWPVKCTAINVEQLAAMRDQLWAEAVALYRSGAKWWPSTDAERELCRAAQAERQTVDPWEQPARAAVQYLETTTLSDLLGLLGVPVERQTHTSSTRAGRVLRAIGWIESGGRHDGRRWGRGLTAAPIKTVPQPDITEEELAELVERGEHLRLVPERAVLTEDELTTALMDV